MPERERFAASEFITRMHKPSPPTPAAHEIERWREQGYRDTARAPRGSAPLATINQAQMRAQDGVTNGVGLRSTYQSPPELVDSASLPYVADEYVMPDSKNHTLSGTDSAHAALLAVDVRRCLADGLWTPVNIRLASCSRLCGAGS